MFVSPFGCITLSGDASDQPGADAASTRKLGETSGGTDFVVYARSGRGWQGAEDARRVNANPIERGELTTPKTRTETGSWRHPRDVKGRTNGGEFGRREIARGSRGGFHKNRNACAARFARTYRLR